MEKTTGRYLSSREIAEYVQSLPNVVYAEDREYEYLQNTRQQITQMIKEHKLNRVVVVSCSSHPSADGQETFSREDLGESELHSCYFEMFVESCGVDIDCVNTDGADKVIRFVESQNESATCRKVKTLIQMAVTKARFIEPVKSVELNITQRALVIGGGLAGITSALGIARQGYEVLLIEREPELGGNLRNIYYTLSGEDVQKHLKSLRSEVENHPKIKVYKRTSIENIDGYIGNYKTSLKTHDSRLTTHEFEHGIIIVATGAGESKPTEYLYGEDERVITQLELEKRLFTLNSQLFHRILRTTLNSIVMIQCVGSRDDEHPYCSRVCCQHAIKNALKIKDISPEVQVFILHRDIRTYGFREKSYALAREKGVCFIRYDEEKKPVVTRLSVSGARLSQTANRFTSQGARLSLTGRTGYSCRPISIKFCYYP